MNQREKDKAWFDQDQDIQEMETAKEREVATIKLNLETILSHYGLGQNNLKFIKDLARDSLERLEKL